MQAVKVLPKGQITLPMALRKALQINEGDILIVETANDQIIIKKGKTLFDFVGVLPSRGMSIDEIREKAIELGVTDND